MSARDAEILERGTRTIVQQVETMQQMVNAFSEYARAPEMQVTRFSLNQLVTEVADLYRTQDPRTRIHLDLDEHIEGIEADRGRVRQILNNLVTNALEALDDIAAPLLEISTRLESGADGDVRGASPCVTMARAFSASCSAGCSTLCHQQAEGDRPGAGDRQEDRRGARRANRCGQSARRWSTRARRAAGEGQHPLRHGGRARTAGSVAEGKSMSSPHILVVDDEADIRGLLKEILSEEGYEVDVAANAAQARASRARQMPDLVLLDIWMPDVDGITLLREWSVAATDGCPVVMMSGHGTVETAVEATRLGAFDFVEKPLSLAKLLRTVERALDAGRRHRQSGRLLGSPLAVPIGKSRLMQQLRAELQQMAANPSPVLLVGEPGSGREAFARYLHEHGPRAARRS